MVLQELINVHPYGNIEIEYLPNHIKNERIHDAQRLFAGDVRDLMKISGLYSFHPVQERQRWLQSEVKRVSTQTVYDQSYLVIRIIWDGKPMFSRRENHAPKCVEALFHKK